MTMCLPLIITHESDRRVLLVGTDLAVGAQNRSARVRTTRAGVSRAASRADAAMEYSRHKDGDPDARGSKSMMEKHAEAQREAMRRRA